MAGSREEAKTARLLELYLFLGNVPAPVGRDRVRANVHGYAGLDDTTFDRQFERDKKDLRAIGVEVEAVPEVPGGQPSRYRLVPAARTVGALDLTAAEAAVGE